MIYVTGDIHGDQILWDACISDFLKEGDNIIVLGDFGIGFFDGRYWPEEMFYDYLSEQKYTVLLSMVITRTLKTQFFSSGSMAWRTCSVYSKQRDSSHER